MQAAEALLKLEFPADFHLGDAIREKCKTFFTIFQCPLSWIPFGDTLEGTYIHIELEKLSPDIQIRTAPRRETGKGLHVNVLGI
jgi:hypothetical protein